MKIDYLMSGAGMIGADWGIAVLSVVCGVIQYWRIVSSASRAPLKVAGRWLIALGWTILSLRLLYGLLNGYDPQIAPPSLIAVAFLAFGTICLALADAGCGRPSK